ncbi:MAG: hypothetical protein H6538_08050 [Bacteroidales bacterium]|nr:hypothetical protein [Bacteroidales bacterium]MCB9000154.1 hypothetical protein [Bacteroidales bacterium]MCB9013511.1 hypothetical protein [Bacteroidales bacterium]
MKKILIACTLIFSSFLLYSQSFNSGEILKPGHISAGINPVLVNNGLGIYLHGGYGLINKVDLGVRYGVFEGADYVGADLEWGIRSTKRFDISLVTGAHAVKYFGLDLGVAASFYLGPHATLLTGVDGDINFNDNNDRFFWWPVGVQVAMSKRTSFILEVDIPLVDFAPGIFGGGFSFSLN